METLRYHTADELKALSLAELRALWDLIPTDRQRAYKAAYEREVRTGGAVGSDQLERKVTAELLARYSETALIPLGSRWARTPGRVQDAARRDLVLDAPENDARPTPGRPSLKIMAVLGVGALLFIVMLLSRLGGGKPSIVADMPPTPSLTPPPAISPTPTPLALESQDDVIQGSDAAREVAYPVSLQIILPDGSAPRLWVVQRRRIQASEWRYDENPDTASFVNGMSVRPIIGIPWSAENAAYFELIHDGAVFQLTMNTGSVQRFNFDDRREVRRSETDIFRQVSPGLALLLIGELDVDGLPTATRSLITASYPPEQELGRAGELIGVDFTSLTTLTPNFEPTATSAPALVDSLDVQIISVTMQTGQLMTRLRLFNGGDATIPISPDDIWLTLGYLKNSPGPHIPAEGLVPFELLPAQAADLQLSWFWQGEPNASLVIGKYMFAIQMYR